MSGQGMPLNPTQLAFVAGQGKARETAFTCALCSCRFTHAGLACGSCPLKAGCDVVQCPHCGFQFPRASGAVEWVRRLLRRGRFPHDDGRAERGRQSR